MSPNVLGCIVLYMGLTLLSGCVSNRIDLVEAGRVRVEHTSTPSARLAPPTVSAEGNAFVVSGNVTRPYGASGIIMGHVHVVVEKDGNELMNLRKSWTPGGLPIKPPYQSSYTIRHDALPPEGAQMRVFVCNRSHRAPTTDRLPSS